MNRLLLSLTALSVAGDVGQDRWQEIDVIRKGGNHGWRLFEGTAEFDNSKGRLVSDFIAPVAKPLPASYTSPRSMASLYRLVPRP